MGAGESTYGPWDGDLPVNALKTLVLGVDSMHRAHDELLFWLQGNRFRFDMRESQPEHADVVRNMIRCMEDQRELWAQLATIVRTPFHKLPHAVGCCDSCMPCYNPGTIESFLSWLCKFSHAQKIFASETLEVQSKLQDIAQSLKPVYRLVVCPKSRHVQVRLDPCWRRTVDRLYRELPLAKDEPPPQFYEQPPGSLSLKQRVPKFRHYHRNVLLGDQGNADQRVSEEERDDFEVNEVDNEIGCGNEWQEFHRPYDDQLIKLDTVNDTFESNGSNEVEKPRIEPE